MTSSQAEQVLRRSHRSRPNKAKLLEAAAADLAEQIRTLAKQNSLLRAKEAMQFEILKSYEDSLHHMGELLCGLADGPDSNIEAYDGALLSAAMLDFRAVELLQQLCASSGTPQPTSNSGRAGSSQTTTSGAQLTAITQQEQRCGTSQLDAEGHTRTGSPAGQSCTGPDKAGDASSGLQKAANLERRTARMWQSVTPEAVVAMQGASVQIIAERIKAAAARIALMSRCTSHSTSSSGMAAAVQEYGVAVMLAMVAADARFLEVTCLNLETMQPESPPEDLWEAVVRKAGPSAAQRLQVYLAFECYRDQRTALLQEQASTVKQLQALLGGPPPPAQADIAPAAQQQAHVAAGVAAAMQQQRQALRAGLAGSNAGVVAEGSAAADDGCLVPYSAGKAAPAAAQAAAAPAAQGVPTGGCMPGLRGAPSSFTSLLLDQGDEDAVAGAPQATPTPQQQQQQPRGTCAPHTGSDATAAATAAATDSHAGVNGINASGSRQRPPQCPQPGSARSTANTASRAAGGMTGHPNTTSSSRAAVTHGTTASKPKTSSRTTISRTSSSRSSSSSGDVINQVMTLDLEAAEQAEALLCQLARSICLQREYSRRLVYLWMDLLSEQQHAEGILAAYPFMIKTPAVCAYIWQQEADKRKGSPIRKP